MSVTLEDQILKPHICFFPPPLPQIWFPAKFLGGSRSLSSVAKAPPYRLSHSATAAPSPGPCAPIILQSWAEVGTRYNKAFSSQKYTVPLSETPRPRSLWCNCTFINTFPYFHFLGCSTSETSKEDRTYHVLSKLRNN